ncbi:MAG TPA: efflux transporter outer membrane subunit [Alcaligenes sp.]|nr:efflux transporter outer membrane subunit [Alcaligenes sp.]HRL25890.1 efflux transporter outer membrane subunit [Alcaligenes sp.]
MKHLTPLLLIALLCGCAALNSQTPPAATLDGPALGLHNQAIQWPQEQWWTRYHDPQLDALLDRALAHHPSLQLAQARIRQADAALKGARAVQWPTLDAGYSLTRQRFSENYIYPPPYAGSMLTDNNLQLTLGFDLDLWGKQRSLANAALSREQAAQADYAAARNALVSAIVQTYFHLQNALAQAQTLDTLGTQFQSVLDITRRRKAAGLDTDIEVSQAESALASARVQQRQAQGNAALLGNQLASLSGQSPEQAAPIAIRPLPQPDTLLPAAIPLELLGRRPDIRAARLAVQASGYQVTAARADFYPNINLNAFAGFMSLGLDQLVRGSSQIYGVGPAISLPLFHGGALNAQLAARRAEQDMAIAHYNQTLLDSLRDVANALTRIHSLRATRQEQAKAYAAIQHAYQIAQQRYQSGLGNYLQVLLAQNDVLRQALLDTELRVQAFNLDAELATALGGGYQEPKTAPKP